MFTLENDPAKMASFLKPRIIQKYGSIRKFCIEYVKLRDRTAESEEIRKLLNRFSKMLQGNGQIQIYDLPFVTELLGISCEEVLSAGRNKTPFSGRVTNYIIASSQERAIWERYMHREDKLFLNFDEYGKSVIDYALDFKNYKFIKYLIDEGFIWLVDPNRTPDGLNYGAGTNVKRRDPRSTDTDVPLEIQYQDELRTRTIALAIENKDVEILDSLLARQVPAMHLASLAGHPSVDFQANRNDELIQAIANADDSIVGYFAEEFKVFNLQHRENTFVFPYLDSVIREALNNNRFSAAEVLLRSAIRQNKSVYSQLKHLMDEAYQFYRDSLGFDPSDQDYLQKRVNYGFTFDPQSHLISFYYSPEKHKYIGFVSNILCLESGCTNPLIKELIQEMNDVYAAILSLKGAQG